MTLVNWSGAARADLDLQYQFLLEIDSEIATRSVRAIVESGGSLAQTP
jgi:plasmid stabilization system protein ParE